MKDRKVSLKKVINYLIIGFICLINFIFTYLLLKTELYLDWSTYEPSTIILIINSMVILIYVVINYCMHITNILDYEKLKTIEKDVKKLLKRGKK